MNSDSTTTAASTATAGSQSNKMTVAATMAMISVTVHLRVYDEDAFRQAARDRALQDGCSGEDAKTYLDAEDKSLGDCAVMLIDPGTGPAGTSIDESTSEVFKLADDEEEDGAKQYRNFYECPCGHSWEDVWTATCDDDCPVCRTTCSPERSEDVE